MVISINLEVRGLEELINNFPKYVDIIKSAADQGLEQGAHEVMEEAKILSPVKTGKLRESIGFWPLEFLIWEVGTDVPYSLYQEVGWIHHVSERFIPGKWYLRNALWNNKERITNAKRRPSSNA